MTQVTVEFNGETCEVVYVNQDGYLMINVPSVQERFGRIAPTVVVKEQDGELVTQAYQDLDALIADFERQAKAAGFIK